MPEPTPASVTDAPHPWTYHDPGDTDVAPLLTDDNGNEVSLGRAWREVQLLRGEVNRAWREVQVLRRRINKSMAEAAESAPTREAGRG